MTDQRWERTLELFDRGVALPRGERTDFLERECADDRELYAAVRRMIDADAAGGLTEPPAVLRAAAADGDDDADVGRELGPYRLLRRIGAGGMGAVYLAERAGGDFEQRVAIKLIKRGMDTEDILARFRNERRLLAQLEHPGVARLIDGGSTDDGRPYLVMELVEGTPIDRYCQERALDVRARCALFREVCEVVHFAHTNGVVHRDLKPSNILVTPDGRPKLLDFGIAKVVDLSGSAHTIDVTLTELRLMTPEYASPEQVRGDPITTATDVYSLGVILYELLCERRPYSITTRLRADLERAVCEEDPPRPSLVAPPALRPALAGDLDNVVMKALRKEPELRYASVHQLGEDLGRHLASEPVVARPSTWRYKGAKFLRRNRVAAAAGAAVVVSLVAGLIVASAMYLRSERARHEAEAREYVAQVAAAALALDRFDPALARSHLEAAPDGHRGWEWRHLTSRLDRSERVLLRGRGAGPIGVSADGRRAAIVLWEDPGSHLVVLDTASWSEVARLPVPGNSQGAAASPDGTAFAVAGTGYGVVLWPALDAEPIHVSDLGLGRNPSVGFVDGARLVAGGLGGLAVLDAATGARLPVAEPGLRVEDLDPFLADDASSPRVLLACGDAYGLLDPATGAVELEPVAPGEAVLAAVHAADGTIALGARDGTVRVLRPDGSQLKLRAHEHGLVDLAFLADGRLVSASEDRTLRTWDVATGERTGLLLGHETPVRYVATLPGREAVLSGSTDGTARLWSAAEDDVPRLALGGLSWWSRAWLLADGRTLVTDLEGGLAIFELPGRAPAWVEPSERADAVSAFVWPSPDEATVAVGTLSGGVRLWSVADRRLLWRAADLGTVWGFAFRPGADMLAISARNEVSVRRASDGEALYTLPPPGTGAATAWTPDGARLVAPTTDGELHVYAAETGERVASAPRLEDNPRVIDVSPDGRTLVCGTFAGSIYLLDARTLAPLRRLEGHDSRVRDVAFSPDGARLASSSQDQKVKLWDVETGRLMLTLFGHGDVVSGVAFTRDGRSLVSRSVDGDVRIWGSDAP